MRFYRGQVDERGRVSGYSIGCLGSLIYFWIGAAFLLLIIGWPLLIHGPVGVALEVVWILSPFIVLQAMATVHKARRRKAAPGAASSKP